MSLNLEPVTLSCFGYVEQETLQECRAHLENASPANERMRFDMR